MERKGGRGWLLDQSFGTDERERARARLLLGVYDDVVENGDGCEKDRSAGEIGTKKGVPIPLIGESVKGGRTLPDPTERETIQGQTVVV
jgi:hypothetical protein